MRAEEARWALLSGVPLLGAQCLQSNDKISSLQSSAGGKLSGHGHRGQGGMRWVVILEVGFISWIPWVSGPSRISSSVLHNLGFQN